jgi:excisionase family DNA binding protein
MEKKIAPMPSQGDWLTLSQAAELLGVHPSTVRSWSDQGRLPVHRTRGGHRRYRRSDVALWRESRQADAAADMGAIVQRAIRQTRLQIGEGLLEAEPWYQKLDTEARELYRRSGRALLTGLMNYVAADEPGGAAEARALGYEYASRAHSFRLTSLEAMHAYLFFRNVLMEAMLSAYESAAVSAPGAWAALMRKVTAFTDQVMLTLVETYEAYERAGRER